MLVLCANTPPILVIDQHHGEGIHQSHHIFHVEVDPPLHIHREGTGRPATLRGGSLRFDPLLGIIGDLQGILVVRLNVIFLHPQDGMRLLIGLHESTLIDHHNRGIGHH